jgi:flagellar biogenesis protein FliO
VIREVEKKLSRRQQIVMSVGSMAIMAALIWFLWWAVKILRRYGILKI